MHRIWLLRMLTFLASFLLFQIQFIVGKIFLANFGGGFMVWGACMVFFQGALLLGYFYAYKILEKIPLSKYLMWHFFLFLVPLLSFPGRLLPMRHAPYGFSLVVDIFILLIVTIGPAFFVLSTISILSQAWLSNSDLEQRTHPYALFAVSNAGSLLALLSYPFVFEMFFDLAQQQQVWRILYVFIGLFLLIGIRLIPVRQREVGVTTEKIVYPIHMIGTWFFYSAAGVSFFLAVTNVMTGEIAPMPFLWMIPLALYLFSYIVNFKEEPWSLLWMDQGMPYGIALAGLLYFFVVRQVIPAMTGMVLMLLVVFFVCFFCQKRLYLLRPDSRGLTFFYFIVSLGGFAGGVLTTWFIPLLYTSHAEYFLGLLFLLIAWFLEKPQEDVDYVPFFFIPSFVSLVYFGPFLLSRWTLWGFVLLIILTIFIFYFLQKKRSALLVAILLILLSMELVQPRWYKHQYLYGKRNYYGMNKVSEVSQIRMFLQGTTVHGAQFLDPDKDFIPLTYYSPQSPAAQLLIYETHYERIGMVGLGTGALAMYPRADQIIDFYELDPDVLFIARTYFSYLKKATAQVNVVINDARVGLERNHDKKYDILIIDAFSGDSVPVHLLNLECLELYRQRLTPRGVVLFHLSNRYVNLMEAFLATASATDAFIIKKQDVDSISGIFKSDWMALTYDQGTFDQLVSRYGWIPEKRIKSVYKRPWTDKYSNVIPYFFRANVFSSIFNSWQIQ